MVELLRRVNEDVQILRTVSGLMRRDVTSSMT